MWTKESESTQRAGPWSIVIDRDSGRLFLRALCVSTWLRFPSNDKVYERAAKHVADDVTAELLRTVCPPITTDGDALDSLCLTLYAREARACDYIGGSNAQVLRDATEEIKQLRVVSRHRTALKEVLERLDRRGGLGLDVHEQIRAVVSQVC